jgi:ATP-dependent RNA helicase DeaD
MNMAESTPDTPDTTPTPENTGEGKPEITKRFDTLGLSADLLNAVNQKGFEEPTDIQALTIPVMLRDDTNIIAQAQTGTGKTAAFGLPLIDMITEQSTAVQALVLVPTRELAIQVAEEIHSLRGKKNLQVVPIYGGQSIDQQLRRLKRGVHIVVGTPGRVIDHLERRTLKLGGVEHLILDEADEMLNMGFVEDIEKIMEHTKADKRTLLFSATMPGRIKQIAKKYMDGYELISAKKQLATDLTEQIYFEVKASDKFEALSRIIDIEDDFYGLIFCRTKIDVDTVTARLNGRGYDSEGIHGDFSQQQRERTLNRFKNKTINILVATDVAARGIDVNNLTHVINFSLPHDPEAYVHRIGRTGRAGNEGTAITFITTSEYRRLMAIQRFAKTNIKKAAVPKIEDIIAAKKKKINEELAEALAARVDSHFDEWARDLLNTGEPAEVFASLLHYCFKDQVSPDAYGYIGGDTGDGKRQQQEQTRQLDVQGKTRLFVALGKADRMHTGKLIKLLMDRTDLQSRDISGVQVLEKFSFITVPFEKAEALIATFKEKGKKPLIAHIKEKSDSEPKPGPRSDARPNNRPVAKAPGKKPTERPEPKYGKKTSDERAESKYGKKASDGKRETPYGKKTSDEKPAPKYGKKTSGENTESKFGKKKPWDKSASKRVAKSAKKAVGKPGKSVGRSRKP